MDGTVRFECVIDALPKAKISWHMNEKELTAKDGVKFETDLKTFTYSLVISKVLSSHVGAHTVKASNTIGESEKSFVLELLSMFLRPFFYSFDLIIKFFRCCV
jgi:hypothetical protein